MDILKEEVIDQLKYLVRWARDNGIASLQLGELQVTFYPQSPTAVGDFLSPELRASEEDLETYSSR